jgi:hypothetical protein
VIFSRHVQDFSLKSWFSLNGVERVCSCKVITPWDTQITPTVQARYFGFFHPRY